MTNDLIADFLTRIRNAILRNEEKVSAPASKMIKNIAKILKEEGYLADYKEEGRMLILEIAYNQGKSPFTHLERVSKPGLRVYVGYKDVPKVLNGLGISILSTSKGIMTGKQANLEKVGGELLCKIW
jgi:small subunit ribosomal protein S8